jgi:hypothetical protein
MRKRLLLPLAVFLCLVVALLTLIVAFRKECPVNAASVARVRNGMTRTEVEGFLGGPPGDYRRRSRSLDFDVGLAPLPGNSLEKWRGDEGLALIQFGPDERVIDASFALPPEFDSWWERVLGFIGF